MSGTSNFTLYRGIGREKLIDRIGRFLRSLSIEQAWEVEVKKHVKRRSNGQNAFLWGVVYPTILEKGGPDLAGWTADDLHEFFLGQHFGTEEITLYGRLHERALRRSSKLSTVEFMDYVASIQRFMSERGVYVADPNEGEL